MLLKQILVLISLTLIAGLGYSSETRSSQSEPFTVVVCPHSDGNPRNSEGDIVVLKDGTLLLAWSRFSGRADHARADIAAKTSRDGGRTWSEEFTLQENTGKQNVMSVSFLRLRSGSILFFYLQKNSDRDLQLFVRESHDDAKTWSSPRRVTQGPGYHIMNNARAAELSDGRILVPIATCPDIRKDYNKQVCVCYRSDNGGKTWVKSAQEIQLNAAAAMEPGVVECADGSVLMVIRTELDRVYKCASRDRGETWTKAEAMELVSPASPATTARIPDSDDLLIVWNNNPSGSKAGWKSRTPLTTAISSDGGVCWKHLKNIASDPNSGYAYTSITFYKDRVLLTYYHWRRGKKNFEGTDTVFHSIPIEWFYKNDG